ncbi:hypothetical protein AVU38_gp004 [Ralstonia phage RSL2]|uniref:SH3 fold domain-containing protein n=1 Tax=Ralstonia phage RSL2 TaxID=1585840 RepID=A0A0A8J8M2_9CAUD|nr:hypothetical protein AVU38_gp004 [Ralstonia phage RSL2]BAQ02532.1 hypothetical protein [Ralstonia phage RSL2]
MSQLMDNKKIYDFETYAPNVLGTSFKRVEILGYFPFETAVMLQGDIQPVHAAVVSSGNLPTGFPGDPRQYNYYRIKKIDGTITIIGEPWIDPTSITEVQVSVAGIVIPNVSTSDLARLTTMLKQAGFINFQITFNGNVTKT